MLLWWRLSLQMPWESSPFWEALHVPMPRECSRESDSFPSWFPCGLCGMGLVFWRILMLSSEKRCFDLETWDHSSSFSILSGGKMVCSSGYKRILHPKAERAETSNIQKSIHFSTWISFGVEKNAKTKQVKHNEMVITKIHWDLEPNNVKPVWTFRPEVPYEVELME